MTQTAPADWWQSLYDDIVADVFLVRKDPDELRATVAFLIDRLALAPGDTVFDQCCGIGALSLPLARAGLNVVGVDQCAGYVARAREEAAGAPCTFHVGDGFSFRPDRPADAAVNWATSFGNADDARNLEMLRRALEALRPGGRFALDYQNVPHVLRTFQRALVYRHHDGRGETLIVRESTIDLGEGVHRQRWTFVLPDGRRRVQDSAVRLYLPHQLAGLLREAGFADVAFHGGVRGEPLTLDSPRCVLVARRPA
jgi:SAM-dependent methyltransferase